MNTKILNRFKRSGLFLTKSLERGRFLWYKDWRYFEAVIEKAKIACQNSEITDIDHFVVDNKMVEIGSGEKRKQKLKKDNIQSEKKDNVYNKCYRKFK